MHFNDPLNLFQCTLATERSRPDVQAAMLDLARPDTINEASSQVVNALTRGERVWITSDLHLGHANVIEYSKRPFFDVMAPGSLTSAPCDGFGRERQNELLVRSRIAPRCKGILHA
ncbi:hypothetical protein [Acidovorax sp.]|uniref:hypothetical protein n=1 Tax=Acidovorax sp. TaxID=1872122 RepID=UPI003D0093C6